MRWVMACLVWAAVAMGGAARAADAVAGPTVAVVVSDGLPAYTEALAAFSAEFPAHVVLYDLRGEPKRAQEAVDALQKRPPALVWAMGPLAAQRVREGLPQVAEVFSFVPNHERYDWPGPTTGVALTRGPRLSVELLQAVAPQATRVLVPHDAVTGAATFVVAQRAAQGSGMEVVGLPLSPGSDVAAVLATQTGIGAVWMVPDRAIASLSAFEALTTYARNKRIPLLSLGMEQVQAGALLAVSADPGGTGRQVARLARRIVREGTSPRALPVVEPESVYIDVNMGAAQALWQPSVGIDLLGFAARHHFTVRAHP